MQIQDNKQARKDIEKYNLVNQYKKACDFIKNKQYHKVQLKLRKPKTAGIYQFRITKKYKAFAIRENDTLYVFEISDHQ